MPRLKIRRRSLIDKLIETKPKIGVKTIVENWYSSSLGVDPSSSLPNYGFITKWENGVEFNSNTQIQPVMQFYSVDTNTIYPPQLEFKWDDYETILTGSATGSILKTTNIVSSLAENPGVFTPQGINRFRFNVAPKYPERVWTTSSLTRLDFTFNNCTSFNQDLSNWDTVEVFSKNSIEGFNTNIRRQLLF